MDFTRSNTNIIVSPWFRDHYSDAWGTSRVIKAKPYVRGPVLTTDVDIPSALSTLDATTGWVPGLASVTAVGTNIKVIKESLGSIDFFRLVRNDGTTAAHLEDEYGWTFATIGLSVGDQEVVQALAYYLVGTYDGVVNPIIMVATAGVGQNTVIHDGALVGTFNEGVPNGAYLVAVASGRDFYAGSLQVRPALPRWESAHAEHLWLTPQRINFIANPRFAHEDLVHWRAGVTGGDGSAAVTRIDAGDFFAGRVVGSDLNGARSVLESNLFPVTSFWASVSLRLRGYGTAHLGLVSWPADYHAGPTFTESLEVDLGPQGVVHPSAPNTAPTTDWIDHYAVRESSFAVCSDGRVIACWVEVQSPNQWTVCTGYAADELTFMTDTNSVSEANEITDLLQTDRSSLHASITGIEGALYLYIDNESREDEVGYVPAIWDGSIEIPPETYGTYVYKSLDDGATWVLHGTLPVVRYVATAYDGTWGGTPFGQPIVPHPSGKWTIVGPEYVNVFGGNGAVANTFVSGDQGATWATSGAPFGNATYGGTPGRGIAVASNGNMYFAHSAFNTGTSLHRSLDGGTTWTVFEGWGTVAPVGEMVSIGNTGTPMIQSPWNPDEIVLLNSDSTAAPQGGDLWVSSSHPPTAVVTGYPLSGPETWSNYRSYGLFTTGYSMFTVTDEYVSVIRNQTITNLGAYTPQSTDLDKFMDVHFLVKVPQDAWELQLRIEFEGDTFWVTDVLVDPHEGQYEYFDGSDTSGLPYDFRWMGGLEHEHFSLWYNNEQNANARLFGLFDTDDEEYKYGLLESWAPTGATFVPHWNAIGFQQPLNWVGDYFYPLVDIQGTPVTGSLTYVDETDSIYADEDGVPYASA